MKDLLLAALVLAVLIIIIFSVTKLFKWIKTKIEKQKGDKIKGVKIRNYEFLDTDRQVTVLFSLLNILKWFIILILVYMSLTVLFGIFPWTVGLGRQLFSYFLDPIKNILISYLGLSAESVYDHCAVHLFSLSASHSALF